MCSIHPPDINVRSLNSTATPSLSPFPFDARKGTREPGFIPYLPYLVLIPNKFVEAVGCKSYLVTKYGRACGQCWFLSFGIRGVLQVI
jgi:hypothetical protein